MGTIAEYTRSMSCWLINNMDQAGDIARISCRADVRRLCWLMPSPCFKNPTLFLEPYLRSEKISRKRGMVLARMGQNAQVFIDLEYTARRTLTVIGCSKTMMMINPRP